MVVDLAYNVTDAIAHLRAAWWLAVGNKAMWRVCITGPESSGKTTLALDLAKVLGVPCVAEYAREYLSAQGGRYDEQDLLRIARGQVLAEERAMSAAVPGIVCDTDCITVRIWAEEKYGRCDPWVYARTLDRHYDLWLLCAPDMPWEPDALREDPHDRMRLFDLYRSCLETLQKPHVVLRGNPTTRVKDAMKHMRRALPGIGPRT
jgi:NadR type nicotinamide-nucleotide adenylyltransferase